MASTQIEKELLALKNKEKALILQGFFKTGPGQYGEGDIFLGITVPEQRKVARRFLDLSLSEIERLLHSKYHEFRLTALIILVEKFRRLESGIRNQELGDIKRSADLRKSIYDFYLRNTKWINNWDLVDLSAPYIVGGYIVDATSPAKLRLSTSSSTMLGTGWRGILDKLAKSKNLWERRIAVVATLMLIRNGEFDDTIKLARLLLKDKHDLMHKAVGWALREMGKKSETGLRELYKFLEQYSADMPRTMLRYAIERLPEEKRVYFMNKPRG